MNETLWRHKIHDRLVGRLKDLLKRRSQAVERKATNEVSRLNVKIKLLEEIMTDVLNCPIE